MSNHFYIATTKFSLTRSWFMLPLVSHNIELLDTHMVNRVVGWTPWTGPVVGSTGRAHVRKKLAPPPEEYRQRRSGVACLAPFAPLDRQPALPQRPRFVPSQWRHRAPARLVPPLRLGSHSGALCLHVCDHILVLWQRQNEVCRENTAQILDWRSLRVDVATANLKIRSKHSRVVNVMGIAVHDRYVRQGWKGYDLALLKLEQKLKFSWYVAPIAILDDITPIYEHNSREPHCFMAGWQLTRKPGIHVISTCTHHSSWI